MLVSFAMPTQATLVANALPIAPTTADPRVDLEGLLAIVVEGQSSAGGLARPCDLPKRLLEVLRRLGSFARVCVVHDDVRHAAHAALQPVAFPLPDLAGELVAFR